MTRTMICGMLALALAAIPNTAAAQSTMPEGPWQAELSASLGSVADGCEGCPPFRLGPFDGLALRAGLSRAATSRVRLGVEGMWWEGEEQGVSRRLTLAGASVAWFPFARGFRLDGGISWFHYRESDLRANGVTFQAGVSWELALTRALHAGPFVRYFRSAGGGASVDGKEIDLTFSPRMLDAGVRIAVGF